MKKKKLIITITIFVLVAVIVCLSCFTIVWLVKKTKNTDPEAHNPKKKTYEGTHIFTAPETDLDLVKNGSTNYRLLLPEQTKVGAQLKTAKDEFVTLFHKATGISLRCDYESEEGYLHNEQATYISLGDTKMSNNAGVTADKSVLGKEGVRIQTVDKSVYLKSGSELGVVFAVYDFMSIVFNYDYYYRDCYEIDTNVSNVKLRNFDVTDVPDIPYRATTISNMVGVNPTADELMVAYRSRYSGAKEEQMMKVFTAKVETEEEFNQLKESSPGAKSHNTKELLPKSDYADHGLWFGDDGTQLCYSAHGNEAELNAMAKEVARKISVSVRFFNPVDYPERNRISVTVEDGGKFCTCDTCASLRTQYGGTDSGVVIRFLNKVCQNLREWFALPENEPYRRDDFKVVFFAYNSLSVPPATYNDSTGKWEPMDETVQMDELLSVYYAMNSTMAYGSPIYDEINDSARSTLDAWSDMTDDIMYWTYATNFASYFYFYDVFNWHTPEAYAYMAASDAYYWFTQCQTSTTAQTVWQSLLIYLDSKLKWDTSLDLNTLINGYMNAMYREAAPEMKALFVSMRTHYNNMILENFQEHFIGERYYKDFAQAKYWSYGTLKEWSNICDRALEKIAHYQYLDKELYQSLMEHIEMEWASPALGMLQLYSDKIPETEFDPLRTRFMAVVEKVGFIELSEGREDMTDFINGLTN